MKQTNIELLKKFRVLKDWMVADTERAMFDARANFLVAQGLLNYTEIAGSFIKPDGNSGESFDAFFGRMGAAYQALLRRFNYRRKRHPHIIYDDLRCGLTHEYTIKRKNFTIYNPRARLSDEEISNLAIVIEGVKTNCDCGVICAKGSAGKDAWLIINPKYWLDFKNALDAYWQDLNNPRNKDLRKRFFRRARQVNLVRFKVV